MENRWWEYYVVRYFVGSVVGAMLVVSLPGISGATYANSLTTIVDFKESKFIGFSLVAALGFAFCYISSSPILTLHTTRAHLQMSVLKERWFVHTISILAPIAVFVSVAWNYLSPISAILIGVIIGFQVGMIAAVLITKFSYIESFYRKLAEVRSKALVKKDEPATAGMEYITSYRHLREHGNAFSILLLELILAWSLYQLCSGFDALFLLLAWIVPSAFSWVAGTILESRYVSSPLS